MTQYEKSIIPLIEAVYDTFTPVERNLADFFIHNHEETDFSAKHIAQLLFTSEATLSRFAKKCGFQGYREFIYRYQDSFQPGRKQVNGSAELILSTYEELLNKSYDLVDEEKMERISHFLTTKKRVYIYGKGSSGLVAQEIKLRFMRIGVDVETITDNHVMRMNAVMIRPDCLVIGISVSGKTEEILTAISEAKRRGAATVLITSKARRELQQICDEILLIPVKENLEYGNIISPQFPVLIIIDILYACFLKYDKVNKEALYDYTLHKLRDNL